MLRLDFAGWFQCRLATDPDPADEPRGVSGWTFAVGDEPDLDRIIRFQDPPVTRSYGPPVGVTVRAVADNGTPVADHPLAGARLDLLDRPRFEGRNGLVTEDGLELIDPFRLRVSGAGVVLERADPLDPRGRRIPEVTAGYLRRRTAGGVEGGPEVTAEVLAATGIADPDQHLRERAERLRAELAATGDPTAKAALGKRIRALRTLMAIRISYRFDVGELGGVGTVRDEGGVLDGAVDPVAPWPVAFWLGGWDADALCGFASGRLTLPAPGGG